MKLPTRINKKTSIRILGISIILFIVVAYALNKDVFNVYLEEEYFTNLRNYFLFNNYKQDDKPCQSRLLNLHHAIGRTTSVSSTFKHPDSHYLSNNSVSPDDLVPLNTKELGYINRLVQIKYGSLCLVPSNNDTGSLHFRNIKLDTKGYKQCCFKIVLGLSDPKCVSFYHIDSDKFICRKPDGSLFLAHHELVDCKARHAFSFKLCRGLLNGDKVVVSCPRINKELRARVWQVSRDNLDIKNIPKMIPLDEINNPNKCELSFIDCHSGVQLGTKYEGLDITQQNNKIDRTALATGLEADDQQPYGLHLPGFFNNKHQDYATASVRNLEGFQSGRAIIKGKNRALVSGLCDQNTELTDNEIDCDEIFPENALSSMLKSYSTHTHHQREAFQNGSDDAVDANLENNVAEQLKPGDVFGKITGGNAESILSMDVVGKNYSELLSDSLMNKLQQAKLDPSVQNLMDYNERLYNVYQDENREYSDKLEKQKEEHINTVDTRIRQANNYRINQMAKNLFSAENLLKEKQESN